MDTVAWTQVALDDLTSAWLSADALARRQMTAAMTLIKRHLRANAPRLGESRTENVRVLIVEPLGIEFQVSDPDRLVTVIRAWRLKTSR